jgi:Sec-independent protein translocase protein TatA
MYNWQNGFPGGGMLVRMTSSSSGEMLMLGGHAHVLFGWIGKEPVARGVFTREQLPQAIRRLRQGVEEEKHALREAGTETGRDREEKENGEIRPHDPVTLGQRAQPLIRLMERTLKEGGFILWEAPGDF